MNNDQWFETISPSHFSCCLIIHYIIINYLLLRVYIILQMLDRFFLCKDGFFNNIIDGDDTA